MLDSDFSKIKKLLKKLGLEYTVFNNPKFIHEDAINAGCKFSINIHGVFDINFDENGKCIGSSTNDINSFKERKV